MPNSLTPERTGAPALREAGPAAARDSAADWEGAGSAAGKAAFFLRMRARGIQDRAVLRAFELIPRAFFADPRHGALAARDVPLPLPCGQIMPEPWLLARMIEALNVAPEHHVLEIGAGSGYATAILAALSGDVIGIERFQTLARAAQGRLASLETVNAAIVWGMGSRCRRKLAHSTG